MATSRRRGTTSSRKSSSARSESRGSSRRSGSSSRSSSRGSSRSASSGKGRKAVSSGFRGAAGREKLKEELERQEQQKEQRKAQQGQPFRLRLGAGETKEVIVLDDREEDLFFQYEHNLQDPKTGYWNVFTGCIKETEICPVCEQEGKESYYALYLSVIDLTEYEDKHGNVVEFSRKLMPVKSGQIGKFLRRLEKNNGSLRGCLFELSRDGDRDPQIGNDIEFIEVVPEEELETYIREWEDKEGKTHEEDCSQVLDYDELFPAPTEESLNKLIGRKGTNAGSRRQAREELEDEGEEDMEEDEGEWEEEERDDAPWEGEEEEPEEEEEEEPEEEEEERPARRRRSSSSADKPSGRARKPAGSRRTGKSAPSSRRRGR